MIPRWAPLVAAGLVAAAPAVGDDGWLQAPSGREGWRARTLAGETCVVDREGERETCFASQRSELLTDLRETAGGWIAAGHGPAPNGRDLFLIEASGAGPVAVPPPPAGTAPRGRPQLVTDDTRLLGLVWLEGGVQEELEVRAAEWLGGDWGPATTVSPIGVGSQLAPTTTVLDDGRWLLLWTGFDGGDDETLWSAYDGDRWSQPARVHEDNATPDILPKVVAVGHGALAAWNWLDGRDYRLRIAAFDGRAWRLEAAREGRGAGEPRWVVHGGEALLATQTVVPEEWVVLELSGRGLVLRRAALPSGRIDLPAIDPAGQGVVLSWPDEAGVTEVFLPWEETQ